VWRLLRVWSQNEIPNRAPAFPEVALADVVRRLRWWKNGSTRTLISNPGTWRTKFSEPVSDLGLGNFQFRPYSLRRGGATFWFTKHGSLDRLLIQGRGQAPKSAQIYINSGLATLAEMKLPMDKLRGFLAVYRQSVHQPLPSLEHPRKARGSGGRGKRRGVKLFCGLQGDL
jgi:hypothetical protein